MKNNHKFKKKFGQNFLEDKNILNDIEREINISKDDNILEIGVGQGFLTEMLSRKAKKVMAFEIDNDLIPYLKDKFSKCDNITLNHMDFMQFNLDSLKEKYKVIANIPYYITSPIIEKLLQSDNIVEIYIMVQKEVAERITTKKGKEMSSLTHFVSFYADTEYLFTVKKEKFIPVPKVDSAFIKIKKVYNKFDISSDIYFEYVKKAFLSKRKTLSNNLKCENLEKVLNIMNKSSKIRAEEFTVEEFVELVKRLNNEFL